MSRPFIFRPEASPTRGGRVFLPRPGDAQQGVSDLRGASVTSGAQDESTPAAAGLPGPEERKHRRTVCQGDRLNSSEAPIDKIGNGIKTGTCDVLLVMLDCW